MPNGSTLPQRKLGRRLRLLREQAGLTLETAAPRLDWSSSTLGRIETARQGVHVHGVRSMLDLYGVGGDEWEELIGLARAARQKGWWHAYGIRKQGYIGLETDAASVRDYQLAYVPGLLQTTDYMRALFRGSRRRPGEDEIERDIRVRLHRQRRLTDNPPLKLAAIVDESVLHRPVGGRDVQRAQLRHLVERIALPSVCFQVLPLALGVHAGLDGSFTVLDFDDPDEPDVGYLEHTVSALHVEKAPDVASCSLVFDQLRSEALHPDESADLVRRLVDTL